MICKSSTDYFISELSSICLCNKNTLCSLRGKKYLFTNITREDCQAVSVLYFKPSCISYKSPLINWLINLIEQLIILLSVLLASDHYSKRTRITLMGHKTKKCMYDFGGNIWKCGYLESTGVDERRELNCPIGRRHSYECDSRSVIQGKHKGMVRFQKWTRNLFFSPYTGTTYTVSSSNSPSFSCATISSLLMLTAGPRSQFARWRRSRKRLSVYSVLRCPDLWLQCSVCFVDPAAPH